jgi:hypothetical protein
MDGVPELRHDKNYDKTQNKKIRDRRSHKMWSPNTENIKNTTAIIIPRRISLIFILLLFNFLF